MREYQVTARRWEHGWELHIDGIGVTQSRTLDGADRMVRDYVETLTGEDCNSANVVIRPDLDGLEKVAEESRRHTEEAARLQRQAAAEARGVARELRRRGLSVSDTAAVLHVSRGRVSQLVSATEQG